MTAQAFSPSERRLLEHRRAMRQLVDSGNALPRSIRVRELYLLRKAARHEEALVVVEDLLVELGLVGEILNQKGLLLDDLGDDEGALAAFQAAATADSASAVWVGNLGCQLADLGRRSEGVALMRRALSMNPHLGNLYEFLADVLRHHGNEEGAQRELAAQCPSRSGGLTKRPWILFPGHAWHIFGSRLESMHLQTRPGGRRGNCPGMSSMAATAAPLSQPDSESMHGKAKSRKAQTAHPASVASIIGYAAKTRGRRATQNTQRGVSPQRVGTEQSGIDAKFCRGASRASAGDCGTPR